MRTSSTKNSLIIGISIVLGASLLSVGVSNAAGSSIKACAKKSNGAMRLIDVKKKCKKSERTLTWGTKGAAGAKGAKGTSGANGLSTVYSKAGNATGMELSSDPNKYIEGIALTLPDIPAGSYLVSISSQLDQYTNNVAGDEIASPSSSFVDCTLTSAENWAGQNEDTMIYPKANNADFSFLRTVFLAKSDTDAGHVAHLASTGTFTLTALTTINLLCGYSEDNDSSTIDGVYLRFPSVTLTKVNQIITPAAVG
jgi:hypothetical protein